MAGFNSRKAVLDKAAAAERRSSSWQRGSRRATSALEDHRILAPLDGVLVERRVKGGETIGAATDLFTVVDLRHLVSYLSRPQAELSLTRASKEVVFTADALAGREFTADIDLVLPVVDRDTGHFKLRMRVRRADVDLLRPGMFIRARILTEDKRQALMVPKAAVLTDSAEAVVFAVRDSRAFRVLLNPGLEEQLFIECRNRGDGGLEPGDVVITAGHEELSDQAQGRGQRGLVAEANSADGTAVNRGRSGFAFTATRPVAITMVIAAAVVFGLVGLSRLPVNLLPDISYPTVTVRTTYPGASPQDVEERVSERIQESVSVIGGVRRVVSVSRPEVSDVILEFEWGTKMVFAVSDIRERLDRVLLPVEADEPLVLRYDPSLDPVMTLGLSGSKTLVQLRRIAEEEIERELAELEGVAAVRVRGGDEEEIRISLDERALSLYGIDVATIAQRLGAENVNAASGSIEEGKTEYMVRVIGEFASVDAIEDVVLARRGEVSIRLGQVARVRRAPGDKQVISLVNGRPCVLVDIYKEAGANIVALCESVRDRIYGTDAQRVFVASGLHQATVPAAGDDVDAGFDDRKRAFEAQRDRREQTDYLGFQLRPFDVQLDTLQDQSGFIEDSIDDVLSSAIKGGLFAIAIIYLFLRRFTSTAILAVSIPFSLVATFAPMFMSDIDLNIMSLGGLALGVGMLVDNSIVVLESIARAREEGCDRGTAAVAGVSRVASAVTASTLTTVAVFFPIVFVEGVAGELFRDQALTVVYSLLMSLGVALFVIPMLAARGGASTTPSGQANSDPPRLGFGPPPRLSASRFWLARLLALPFWPLRLLAWLLAGGISRMLVVGLWLALVLGGAVGVVLRLALLPFAAGFDQVYGALDRIYPGVVSAALRARAAVVLASLALLAVTVARLPHLGNEMLPEVHQGELFVDCFLPRDATVERTSEVLTPIEQAIAALDEVERTFLASGVDREELNDSDEGEHSARLLLRLRSTTDRAAQQERVRSAVRRLLRREPEIKSYRFTQPSILSFTAPLVVEVLGRDLLALRRVCAQVQDTLETVPGLRDVRSTLQRGNPEIAIHLDRDKLAALNLDPSTVTRTLRSKVQGDMPTRFTERERKIDIRVRVDRDEIGTISRLHAAQRQPSRPAVGAAARASPACSNSRARARSAASATCAAPRCTLR